MITAEQNEKTMKLSWPQIKRLMAKQIETRIFSSDQSGDVVSAKQWKALSVRMQAKDMTQRINEEFIQDFIKWLTGRSVFNSTKYFEMVKDEYGTVVSKEVTGGCPWGNTPLTNLPGVSEFLDQGIDRRSKVIEYIAKLKMRGPRNLNEAYMYYKYILRKVAVDDDACYEVQEMGAFDYPVDPRTGEVVGPSQVDTPPLFDEVKYTANFLMVYSIATQNPEMTANWILDGAKAINLEEYAEEYAFIIPPSETAAFLYTNDYDLIWRDGRYQYVQDWIMQAETNEEYLERHEEARRETRERERRRRLRKAGRAPSAKMATGATAKKGVDPNIFLGPEGRQKSRRLARREARRDNRQDDEREDLAVALSEENFGTASYVSFWALSGSDQDYIMAMLLAQNAFRSAAQVLESPASTGVAGGPTFFPEARRNEAKYAYPNEETEKVDKGKDKKEGLKDLGRRIRDLPGAASDPATQKILRDIYKTVEKIANKKDAVPQVTVQNNQPIEIKNDGLIGAVKANTVMIEQLKAVIGNLDVAIGTLNIGNGPQQPPVLDIPQNFRDRVDDIDRSLTMLVEVVNGLPVEIAKQIPRPPPGAGGVGSAVPVNPDQIMTDREEFHVGTATVHNPTGNWTVQNQKIDNHYTGTIEFGNITGEDIGKAYADRAGTPQIHLGPVTVQPEVTVQTGNIEVKPEVSVNTGPVTVELRGDQIQVPVPQIYGGVNLPAGLGAEIGRNMPRPEVNVDFNAEAFGRAAGKEIKLDVNVHPSEVDIDLSPLSGKLDKLIEQGESKKELMEIQAEHSRQINQLYEEMKQMRTQESARLDQMKKIIDQMTPLQQAVAGILANDKAAKDIEGDVEIKEKPLPEKLEQVLKLDQDTINKLINGNAAGLKGIKKEITKLVDTVNRNLSAEYEHEGVRKTVSVIEMTEQLVRKAAYQSDVMRRTLEYIPQEFRGNVSPNLITKLTDLANDPNSIFNNAEFKIAEINDKNFTQMTRKISSIEAQLVKEQATLKTQKENLDLLRTQLKQTFDKMQAEATEKTNQEREQIKQESINLRNHYAMKEAEFTQKVNELAALGHSHMNLQKAFEEYKQKRGDKAKEMKEALTDVVKKELVPEIQKASQAVVDAVDLAIGPGADEDEEDQTREEQIEPGEGLTKEEKQEAALVATAQSRVYNYLQEQEILPANAGIQKTEMYIDKTTLETKRTLEQLINEAIARDPKASAYTILKNPIEMALHNLEAFKQEKGHVAPEQLSVEDRLKRNELFTAEAYMSNFENRFKDLPEEIRSNFVNPIAGQSEEDRIKSVTAGLTLLSREKNSLQQSKSSFKRFSELLTNYRATINQMAEDPDWNGKSKLAEDYIGKFTGAKVREMTGYQLDERVMIQPTNASEMDAYTTLVRVGREMAKAAKNGDSTMFRELARQTAGYSSFANVPFVHSSPLYKAMVSGDEAAISHHLSTEGTAHISRDYYTKALKARTDMLYHSFKNKIHGQKQDSQIPMEKESLKHTLNNMTKSGMSESALAVHPDYSQDIQNVSMEEASVYMQAYMRAAMAHNLMKLSINSSASEEDKKSVFLQQTIAKTPSVLQAELDMMKKFYDTVAFNSTTLQADHPDNQLIQKLYQDRQQSIKDLSDKMFNAMSISVLPEFKALTSGNEEIIKTFGADGTVVTAEAVDSLVGLTDGNIIKTLIDKTYETDSGDATSLPSGKLFASQLKNSVEALEKEGKRAYTDLSNAAMSELAKQLHKFKQQAFAELQNSYRNVFEAMPMAIPA